MRLLKNHPLPASTGTRLAFTCAGTAARMAETFEVDMTKFVEVEVDPFKEATLPPAAKEQLLKNIELCRDAVVFFTACGSASGYGGHTGGAYDTMPEAMLLRAFFKARSLPSPVARQNRQRLAQSPQLHWQMREIYRMSFSTDDARFSRACSW
jgi:hypothetical protein